MNEQDEVWTVRPPWLSGTRFHKRRYSFGADPDVPSDPPVTTFPLRVMCGMIGYFQRDLERTTVEAATRAGLTPCRTCWKQR
ncbi:MAG: hypothetical protein GY906_10100 [bacterium]|nr:hypothetical protein [bacterium]